MEHQRMRNVTITVTGLKDRGWTDKLIREHLGEPDCTKPNPRYRKGAPMRLYNIERVEAAENSDEWESAQQESGVRKLAAARGFVTKTAKLMATLDGLKIEAPVLPEDELISDACKHYNARKSTYGYSDHDTATPDSDRVFLERTTVNYLRHMLTPYENEVMKLFGKAGKRYAYLEINRRVYRAIGEAYPQLADECSRQFIRKIT